MIRLIFVNAQNLKQVPNLDLELKKLIESLNLNKTFGYNHALIWIQNEEKKRNIFEKDFFKLMIHSVSKKTMKNFRKHKYIKLVATKTRRNYLVSEPNYHTTKYLLTIEMKRNTYTHE